ncbi:MAG TPA: nitronate monooxygenase [Microlunatus sp.]|nr:nitronate monooxygenase [Microlunatus sp.]
MTTSFDPRSLTCPIVAAPMAGGPSTPALVAAVSSAGGLGFLAAGYQTVDQLRREVDEVRSLLPVGQPFGVNLFVPSRRHANPAEISAYTDRLGAEARRRGVRLGEPRWDDDGYPAKLDQLCAHPVPVVSFTFGCPPRSDVTRLQSVGSAVWVTVTTVPEARTGQHVGADALVVQGVEAGGHRGGFDDARPGDIGLLALLQLITDSLDGPPPLIASGGLCTGSGIAAALTAGALAAQLGTAFLLSPEAGTHPIHRAMISRGDRPTALTRAFTGRTARGITNQFVLDFEGAPSAYPEVHHLTGPLRAAARSSGDAEGCHLWAGQAYALARPTPAGRLTYELTTQTAAALRRTSVQDGTTKEWS